MAGYLAFHDKYRDESACIQALADLKWLAGFICDRCQGRKAYHLVSRPRLFECAACGHQHSITAGTIFHKTRTPLRKWFVAAYLIAHDKRGVSALYLSRELAIRYDTAWLMCHKIRHALTESSTDFLLSDYVEVGETFYGIGKQTCHRGQVQTTAKAMIVCAVQKIRTAVTKYNDMNRQGFVAGSARIAVLPNPSIEQLSGFIRSNIKPETTIVSDGFRDYSSLGKYGQDLTPPGTAIGAGVSTPIVHRLFSNIKTWLRGTHHGVSTKHLPRYLREWSYRFNRRGKIGGLDGFLLRRAVSSATISYEELVAGKLVEGAV